MRVFVTSGVIHYPFFQPSATFSNVTNVIIRTINFVDQVMFVFFWNFTFDKLKHEFNLFALYVILVFMGWRFKHLCISRAICSPFFPAYGKVSWIIFLQCGFSRCCCGCELWTVCSSLTCLIILFIKISGVIVDVHKGIF